MDKGYEVLKAYGGKERNVFQRAFPERYRRFEETVIAIAEAVAFPIPGKVVNVSTEE